MVGPTPEHDRSGNTRAFYELSNQPLAALSDSQLPSLGPLGPLSIERRLRGSRPVARCHCSLAGCPTLGSRAYLAGGPPADHGRPRAALVASRLWRRRPDADQLPLCPASF